MRWGQGLSLALKCGMVKYTILYALREIDRGFKFRRGGGRLSIRFVLRIHRYLGWKKQTKATSSEGEVEYIMVDI